MSDRPSRRRFLQRSLGLGLAALAARADAAALASGASAQESKVNELAFPIVDTHQHLWDLNRLRLPWLAGPEAAPLRHSFLTKDYDAAIAGLNVVKTVYMEVNCDPSQHDVEAEYVIGLCKAPGSRMRGAVIGGSLQSDRFEGYITKYAGKPYVKGVRQVLHDADRPKGMCLERRFVENVRLLGRLGLSFDLCMRPSELVDGVKLMEQCPHTRFIIDHCGNRDVQSTDEKARTAWESGIKAAAARDNAVCKISGIVVTARPKDWKPVDLGPAVNFCLDAFGSERVFFGGDWPVCTLKATYRQWAEALKQIVADRPVQFQKRMFHDNAAAFYKLS